MSSIFKKFISIIFVMDKFKDRVKTLRLENNLSQNALAVKINSSQKIIDYWESGSSEPKATFIIALADCFGVTTDYLLGREDDFGNVNVNSDLTEEEKRLIEIYRNADKKDKDTLIKFANFICKNNN